MYVKNNWAAVAAKDVFNIILRDSPLFVITFLGTVRIRDSPYGLSRDVPFTTLSFILF